MRRSGNLTRRVDSAEAYDRYAPRYDRLLVENRINAYMRREMTRTLLESFPPGSRLVELGCGTGDEALALASSGQAVIATDPAAEMIRIAREKALKHPHGHRVSFHVSRASDLDVVLADEPDKSFDGAYASFSLSYERSLGAVRTSLIRLLKPRAPLVASVMNRLCSTEMLLAIATGRTALAGRRLRTASLHKVGNVATPIYPRTVAEMARAFLPDFIPEKIRALPSVLPPHYANLIVRQWPGLLDAVERIDPYVSGLPIMRLLGDHTIIVFRRNA